MKNAIPKELVIPDRALFKIGKDIEILNKLVWSNSIKTKFLKQWAKKSPQLPKVSYQKHEFSKQHEQLRDVIRLSKGSHPFAIVIRDTAKSYKTGLRMIESIGTKQFMRLSTELYGAPTDPLSAGSVSTARAASKFLTSVRKFDLANITPPEDHCILPQTVVGAIKAAADSKFGSHNIRIVTAKKLKSKASASSSRIRIREETSFAEHDINQLIQHELFVHTLTLLNGRKQPLKTLGLNSPRTTCSQEGLAVFAEFVTNAMDVNRLRRISARVKAIQLGIDGADFIDIFKFFLDNGQTEEESFFSAARVFRGGKVEGGIVFTKDLVYLKGFIQVHQFFLKSLQFRKFLHPEYMISGRLDSEDVELLAPFFEKGALRPPKFEPNWLSNRSTLLAFLLSSSVMNNLGLSKA